MKHWTTLMPMKATTMNCSKALTGLIPMKRSTSFSTIPMTENFPTGWNWNFATTLMTTNGSIMNSTLTNLRAKKLMTAKIVKTKTMTIDLRASIANFGSTMSRGWTANLNLIVTTVSYLTGLTMNLASKRMTN